MTEEPPEPARTDGSAGSMDAAGADSAAGADGAADADGAVDADECRGRRRRAPERHAEPSDPHGFEAPEPQSQIASEMTDWAVMILNDPVTYPMFSTTMKTFGAATVLARVEWVPPNFQNNVVHRGVVLYEPI